MTDPTDETDGVNGVGAMAENGTLARQQAPPLPCQLDEPQAAAPTALQGSESRRSFLKAGTAAFTAGQFPLFRTSPRTKLRVLGTHVTLLEEIREQAMKDLGIDLEFSPGGDPQILHRASTQPEAFDVYEQWSNSIKVLWRAGSLQPISISRLRHWDEINPLSKTGRLSPKASLGAGDSPHKILFVQNDGSLGSTPSARISFMPYVHNADSFGYNSARIPRGIPYQTESWAWLLDEQYRGKVALINEPSIGIFDAALAARAKGLMTFSDLGNLSRQEIDQLISILLDYKRRGQFRGFWSSVPKSVDLMARGEVVLESLFSPAVAELRGRGIPCIYAAPKEGYRAWHGVMCLSAKTDGKVRDAAYAYMNWWLSGWPGAFIARQGYYISNPERSRPLMKPEEWDYWYEGKPAAVPLYGTDGKLSVQKGESRTGGSYTTRFEHVAVWNTVMDHYEYLLLRWKDLLLG